MSDATQDVRNDMRATRLRMDTTISEIEGRIGEAARSVTGRLDITRYAQDYPWAAVGLALGAGLAFGLTGADRKAVNAMAAGAAAAGTAIVDGAVAAKAAVVGLVQHRGDDSSGAESEVIATGGRRGGGVGEHINGAIEGLLFQGLAEVMASLGRPMPRRFD